MNHDYAEKVTITLDRSVSPPGLHSAIPAYRQALNLAWYRAGRRIPQLLHLAPGSFLLAPYHILGNPEQLPSRLLFCPQIIYLEISVDITEFSR
jgi:hypothetical protein